MRVGNLLVSGTKIVTSTGIKQKASKLLRKRIRPPHLAHSVLGCLRDNPRGGGYEGLCALGLEQDIVLAENYRFASNPRIVRNEAGFLKGEEIGVVSLAWMDDTRKPVRVPDTLLEVRGLYMTEPQALALHEHVAVAAVRRQSPTLP